MDPVSGWVANYKIPIGRWGKQFFDFLTENFEWFFDSIADGLTFVLGGGSSTSCSPFRRFCSWR